jgi:DNA polymerase III delta prime subunit
MGEAHPMNHVSTIKMLIRTLVNSHEMHALIVEGPAGWGKTTTVDRALRELGIEGVHLGAYATPLHFFNVLSENEGRTVIIDDCAGLFNDQISMAILKAATWGQSGARKIKWGSSSLKAARSDFLFSGKLVIICNTFPSTPDGDAVRSRSFPHKIAVTESEAKALLLEAAGNTAWYPKPAAAESVARYLFRRVSSDSLSHISYRTLRMGYELAEHNPGNWQELLSRMIPAKIEDPKRLVKQLAKQKVKVKEQALAFQEATGLKRRTFFKYRRELNLAR